MDSTKEGCETLSLPNGEYLTIQKITEGNVYRNEKHSSRFGSNINNMQNQELLCDVTLVADHTEEVRAHKVILAASSLFFYTIFSAGIYGKSEERIVLDGVHRYALPQIIKYIYTGEIFITEDNVERLLRTAHKLVVMDVFNACIHFLKGHITIENCFNTAALAKKYDCVDLLSDTDTFLTQHFSEIVRTQTYLDLPKEQLTEIIQSDRLKISKEIEVFNAVVAWVKHKIEIRHQYLASVMEYVRFPLMSPEDLIEKVEQEPLIEANAQCVKYVREAMRYHLVKGNKKSAFSNRRSKPRALTNSKQNVQTKRVLVAASLTGKKVTMERYDFEDQKWLPGPETFDRPSRDGSVLLNAGEKIYMIGGYGNESRKVDVFDMKHGKWSECSDLLENRYFASAVALDCDIYVFGGFSGEKTCEKLDQQTGRWIRIADMLEGRMGHGKCAMDGKIYAVGGWNIVSAECYSSETNSWTRIPNMSIARSHTGVAALDGKLYVVGGWSVDGCLKCVEVFDSVDQKWTRLPDMNVTRQKPGVVAANGLICVVGGNNYADKDLDSVEVYVPSINAWMMLPNKMGEGRHSVSVAVMDWPF